MKFKEVIFTDAIKEKIDQDELTKDLYAFIQKEFNSKWMKKFVVQKYEDKRAGDAFAAIEKPKPFAPAWQKVYRNVGEYVDAVVTRGLYSDLSKFASGKMSSEDILKNNYASIWVINIMKELGIATSGGWSRHKYSKSGEFTQTAEIFEVEQAISKEILRLVSAQVGKAA